jgi:hypothetical protein
MKTHPRFGFLAGFVLVAAGLGGCSATPAASGSESGPPSSSEKPVFETELAAILDASGSGDFYRAIEQADGVLALADKSTSQGALARFSAAMLAAEAHWRAASGAPFLREPDAAGVRQLSPVAHLMAVTNYLAIARSAAPRAALAEPADSVAVALRNANLIELVVHSRLGLRASVNAFLQRSPELHDAKVCADFAVNAPLAGRRPWLYSALFDYQRGRDEVQAYRFAVLCIDEAPSAGADFDPQRVLELERWILRDASLEFHCPKCDLPVNPGLRACPNDRTPNVDFVGRKRL